MNSVDQMAEPKIEFDGSQVFAIASDKILAKEFDGELTLINLDTGVYFAAGGPTLDVWQSLTAGRDLGATSKGLVTRYKIAESEAVAQAARMAAMLVGYGLLVTSTAAAAAPSDPQPSLDAGVWSEPWLESYGDMQDLLLLDPVHDVQGGAWPKAS